MKNTEVLIASGLGAMTVLMCCMSVLALSANKQDPCIVGDIFTPLGFCATSAGGYATTLAIIDAIKSKMNQKYKE